MPPEDEVKETSNVSTIEPPPGAGMPTEPKSPEPTSATTTGEADGVITESKIKLPASIKPPVKTVGSGRFQQRISDLVAQRDSAARERDELRGEISRMRGGPTTGSKRGEAGDKDTTPTPAGAVGGEVLNPEDFPTYGEYVAALADRVWDQKEKAKESATAERQFVQHRQERMAEFNKQATPLAEMYGDGFWEVMSDPTLPISEAMGEAILELDELGPYTVLWLASHRDIAIQMAKMNPRAATIAIGKLAFQLDYEIKHGENGAAAAEGGTGADRTGQGVVAGQTPAQPTISAAPKPTPVQVPRGSTPNLDNSPSDKDDVETWLAKETARLRKQQPGAKFYGKG